MTTKNESENMTKIVNTLVLQKKNWVLLSYIAKILEFDIIDTYKQTKERKLWK